MITDIVRKRFWAEPQISATLMQDHTTPPLWTECLTALGKKMHLRQLAEISWKGELISGNKFIIDIWLGLCIWWVNPNTFEGETAYLMTGFDEGTPTFDRGDCIWWTDPNIWLERLCIWWEDPDIWLWRLCRNPNIWLGRLNLMREPQHLTGETEFDEGTPAFDWEDCIWWGNSNTGETVYSMRVSQHLTG